jgi:predicted PurR-regulated permease PerM
MDARSSSSGRQFLFDVREPDPVTKWTGFERVAASYAIIGIFVLMLIGGLLFSRAILLPISLALTIGMMFAPLITRAANQKIPSWLTALAVVALFFSILYALVAVLADFIIQWTGKGPEIALVLKEKLQAFDRPLAVLRDLQASISTPLGIDAGTFKFDMTSNFITPVLAILTPAISQIFLFFGTLFFFLTVHEKFRRYLIAFSENRKNRLRILRIFNDVERNLSSYIGILTIINLGIGTLTAAWTALLGLPKPIALGVLAFTLNYIPLIGPAIMAFVLLAVGLVAFPSLGYALIAPCVYIAQAGIEGQFATPNIIGRKMTVNPFAIFLSIAFWTWLWGPLGALLAMPVLIVAMVVYGHVFPKNTGSLPE